MNKSLTIIKQVMIIKKSWKSHEQVINKSGTNHEQIINNNEQIMNK